MNINTDTPLISYMVMCYETGIGQDIARYLNSDVMEFDEQKENWIYTWWRGHADEYAWQQLQVITYLAVPALEVVVERLFNA